MRALTHDVISPTISIPAATASTTVPAPGTKAVQTASAGSDGAENFHQILKAAGDSLSQPPPPVTLKSTSAVSPKATSVATILEQTIAATGDGAAQPNDSAMPVAADADQALDASKLSANPNEGSLNEANQIRPKPVEADKAGLLPVGADPVKSPAVLDAVSVKPKDANAKRKHSDAAAIDANPQAANTAQSPTAAVAAPFQLPQAIEAVATQPADEASSTTALTVNMRKSTKASSTPTKDETTASNGPADAVSTDDAQPVAAIPVVAATAGGGGKGHAAAKDAVVDPEVKCIEAPAALAAHSIHLAPADAGATFRSSFLSEGSARPDLKARIQAAVETVTEPVAPTSDAPVKHLEVSLRDAGLGDISVRAEMRDGILHAAVVGGHVDTFLTATALHQFLDSSQVAVHRVQVETQSPNGVTKTVSTSSFASGSFAGGDGQSGGRSQQERSRTMPSGDASTWNLGQHNDSSRMPVNSAPGLPSVQYGDGRSLSIHI